MRPQLVQEIRNALGAAVLPNLTAASAASDLYEAYVFGIVLDAARAEGAQITYEDVSGGVPTSFYFRTSPGQIWSTAHPYCHAVVEFPNKPALEVHVGIRSAGRSGVLHECDVAVMYRDEATACRSHRVPPRHSSLIISVECKFYTTDLPLHLARAFLGLGTDLRADACYFVVNTSSGTVEKLLEHHNRKWEHQIYPGATRDVERLRNSFQKAFKGFIARSA